MNVCAPFLLEISKDDNKPGSEGKSKKVKGKRQKWGSGNEGKITMRKDC
jgi:hypothetical protein